MTQIYFIQLLLWVKKHWDNIGYFILKKALVLILWEPKLSLIHNCLHLFHWRIPSSVHSICVTFCKCSPFGSCLHKKVPKVGHVWLVFCSELGYDSRSNWTTSTAHFWHLSRTSSRMSWKKHLNPLVDTLYSCQAWWCAGRHFSLCFSCFSPITYKNKATASAHGSRKTWTPGCKHSETKTFMLTSTCCIVGRCWRNSVAADIKTSSFFCLLTQRGWAQPSSQQQQMPGDTAH